MSQDRTIVSISLNRRSKNHLGSMYFGAFAAGADCAGGLMAMKLIKESGQEVSLAFKDFKADFLKRAEGDTHFVCEQGKEIRSMIDEVLSSGERINRTISAYAVCPTKSNEPVANLN